MTSGSYQEPSSTPPNNLAPVFPDSVPQMPDSPVLEVARDIARSLNDTPGEEPLPATEMLSIEPLAISRPETMPVNPPSTQQPSTQQVSPSTHRAGASQNIATAVNTGTLVGKDPSPYTAATSTSNTGKRPGPEEERPRLFSPRKKHAAQRPKRVEHVTLSENIQSTSPLPPAPAESVNPSFPVSIQEMPHFPSGSFPEDGADS
ncbi:hypothetical protein LIER_06357 [Lithospermum erythrorhizon]|uniref:Uncharacterized protein n=1 Tax=Lithospermum erythrorhizon TaxID=34254 RepID=A0AAV3P480_LITER